MSATGEIKGGVEVFHLKVAVEPPAHSMDYWRVMASRDGGHAICLASAASRNEAVSSAERVLDNALTQLRYRLKPTLFPPP